MTTVPKIVSVAKVDRSKMLLVTWEEGAVDAGNLAAPIARHEIYAPLERPVTFAKVPVGEWGRYVEWSDGIDMPAHALWRLAGEQHGGTLPVSEVKVIRVHLGLSKRMIIFYEQGTHIVPKATARAMRALEAGLTIDAAISASGSAS